MFGFDSGVLVPMMIFAIPIVAVAGGITLGIVKTLGQQRLVELAQRERIAAIERGVDPAKLPPMPVAGTDDDSSNPYLTYAQRQHRRMQGLVIGGLITLFVGIALAIFLSQAVDGEDGRRAWLVGLIPASVGVALLLSAMIVRPRDNGAGSGPTAPHA